MPFKDKEKEREYQRKYKFIKYQQNKVAINERVRNDPKQQTRLRKWHLKHTYNLDWDDYILLIEKQHNKCAICKQESKLIDNRTGKIMRLHVDHDHKTGKVRGLLCNTCNRGLGYFHDDLSKIRNVMKYLEGFEENIQPFATYSGR